MSFLTNLVNAIVNGIRAFLGLFLPFFSLATDFAYIGPYLLFLVRVIAWLIVLIGLALLNLWSPAVQQLWTVAQLAWMAKFWLPVVGLIVLLALQVSWWIYRELFGVELEQGFPDLDAAWNEACRAMNRAGIEWTSAPLFLVLGRTEGGEEALFNAAQLNFEVKGVPREAEAPLRVYAGKQAIFVTCPDASLLGKHAELLTKKVASPEDDLPAQGGFDDPDQLGHLFVTMGAQDDHGAKQAQAILADAEQRGRNAAKLTEEEREQLDGIARGNRGSLMRNKQEVERCAARLRQVCRLIQRVRTPFCPVNGILLLVPIAAAEKQEYANDTGTVCQSDLAEARSTLQLLCPVFTLVVDLETLPGAGEFLKRFQSKELMRRVGFSFPLVPDLPNAHEEGPQIVADCTRWICQTLIATWVYRGFENEAAQHQGGSPAVAKSGNVKLYRLMNRLRDRQQRLAQIIKRAVTPDEGAPMLFGGCYLAATGARDHLRAFITGVFRRPIEEQDNITWTRDAIERDANYNRLTTIGYCVIAVLIVLGITAAILWGLGILRPRS